MDVNTGTLLFMIIAVAVIFVVAIIVGLVKGDGDSTPDVSKMTPQQRLAYLKAQNAQLDAKLAQSQNKKASVTKRAVAGTIIGGVPGAIIGAASAIDKNNKNK